MKLQQDDAKLFFNLMRKLQFYVKQKLKLLPEVGTLEDFINVKLEENTSVRDALWKNVHLIKDFIEENPYDFTDSELDTLTSWKQYYVQGTFFLERFLKTNAIFIDKNDSVYAVIGLHSAFDEMIPKERLPLTVELVLLPFQGKIVYDGIMKYHNIFIGRNMAAQFKETYLVAKQRGQIISTLPLEDNCSKGKKGEVSIEKQWGPELENLALLAKKLKGGPGQSPLCDPAFGMVRAALDFAKLAADNSTNESELIKGLNKFSKSYKKAHDVLSRW